MISMPRLPARLAAGTSKIAPTRITAKPTRLMFTIHLLLRTAPARNAQAAGSLDGLVACVHRARGESRLKRRRPLLHRGHVRRIADRFQIDGHIFQRSEERRVGKGVR